MINFQSANSGDNISPRVPISSSSGLLATPSSLQGKLLYFFLVVSKTVGMNKTLFISFVT